MPRKRPTETSWDSDEDLLEDESIALNSWSFDKELEGVDEDALLGGDDSENFPAPTSCTGPFSSMNKSSACEGASSYNDPDEEYFQIPSYDDIPPQTDNQVDHYRSSDVDFSDVFVTDNTSDIIGSEPDQSFVAASEKVDRTSYEESDSDEEDGSRCGRFKSERSSTNTAALPKKTADKSEIPDTLEISNEDQQKIDKFMQTSQKKQKQFAGSRQQKGLGSSRPVLQPPKFANYGRQVPSNPTGYPFRNPAMARPMHEGPIGFSQGLGSMRHPGSVMQRQKVLVNPRFCRPQYLAGQRMGYASRTEQQQYQNAPLSASLLGLKSEPYQSFQQSAQDIAPLFMQQGAVLPDRGQHLSNSMALQQRLPVDQCGYSMSHSASSFGFQRQQRPGLLPLPSHLMPSNVVQPVEVPFNQQRSSVPAMVLCQQQPPVVANSKPELLAPPVQQVVTVRSSQIGFLGAPIAQQPLQSNGVVMGPVMQQMPHPLPQSQVVQHVAPAQVRFIAAPPPANPVNVDVLPHHIEQIPPQNFNAAANVGHHRLSAPPIAPSVSGYQSLGHTFSQQEPEAIGQRIETVIHTRSLPHPVPKKPCNEVQRKNSVERQKQQPVSAVPTQNLPASTSSDVQECTVTKEIEQKQKMEARARRFAAPLPAVDLKDKSVGGSNVSSVNHLAVKRLSDQGTGGPAVKQARLTASRKVVARATAVLQQRYMLNLKQQQLQQGLTNGINIEQQSGGDSNQLLLSSAPSKLTEVDEPVAPQRKVSVTNRTVIITDSDQSLQMLEKKEKIADALDVATEEANYDAVYQAKLQAQKELREEVLRKKEMNRQRQARMHSSGTNEQLSQTVNGQLQQQSVVTNSQVSHSANPVSASPINNTVRAAVSTTSVQFRSSRPQVATRALAPSQLQNRATFQQRNITVPVVRPVTGRQPLTNFRKTLFNSSIRPVSLPSHHMSVHQHQQRLPKPDHARLPVAQSFAQPMLRRTLSASHQRMKIPQNIKSYASNIQQQYHAACAKLSGLSSATNALTIRRLAENIGPVRDVQLNLRDKTATVWFMNPGHALMFANKYQRFAQFAQTSTV